MVAGLDFPDRGKVLIGGKEMTRVPPQARDVSMVFQGFALYPHMRVREIMGFPLKMRGVAASVREATVAKTAELLSITRLLDRRPAELSGGEQQRVAMGRAIVREPRCSCSTSRSRTWTPRCARSCASNSASCCAGSRPPRST